MGVLNREIDRVTASRPPEAKSVERYLNELRGSIRYIICPFIQQDTLDSLVEQVSADTIIVTRWNAEDLARGVSDPDVFETCRDQGYTLKVHQRLHSKVYSWDLEEGIVGSANLTGRGMGLSSPANEEYLTEPRALPLPRRVQLQNIVSNAALVDESDFKAAQEVASESEWEKNNLPGTPEYGTKKFLVSEFPQTERPDLVIEATANWSGREFQSCDTETRQCILHDMSTFQLWSHRLEREELVADVLRENFLAAPFIRELLDQLDPCAYFGELTDWIHSTCEDVPTPARREMKEKLAILYSWFPKIDPERFRVDVPEKHSERLCDTTRL